MSAKPADFETLEWDSAFFGFAVARIPDGALAEERLPGVIASLRGAGVRLAYWAAERRLSPAVLAGLPGGEVDERVTLETDLAVEMPEPAGGAVVVEPHQPGMDPEDFDRLAVHSGVNSRFAVDPRIPREKFEELYRIWIRRSLARELAEETLVVRAAGRTVGMITLRVRAGVGEIGLMAVDPGHRGQRLGEHLMLAGRSWFHRRGAARARVVTQAASAHAVALYQRCGYAITRVEHMHHFWP